MWTVSRFPVAQKVSISYGTHVLWYPNPKSFCLFYSFRALEKQVYIKEEYTCGFGLLSAYTFTALFSLYKCNRRWVLKGPSIDLQHYKTHEIRTSTPMFQDSLILVLFRMDYIFIFVFTFANNVRFVKLVLMRFSLKHIIKVALEFYMFRISMTSIQLSKLRR